MRNILVAANAAINVRRPVVDSLVSQLYEWWRAQVLTNCVPQISTKYHFIATSVVLVDAWKILFFGLADPNFSMLPREVFGFQLTVESCCKCSEVSQCAENAELRRAVVVVDLSRRSAIRLTEAVCEAEEEQLVVVVLAR